MDDLQIYIEKSTNKIIAKSTYLKIIIIISILFIITLFIMMINHSVRNNENNKNNKNNKPYANCTNEIDDEVNGDKFIATPLEILIRNILVTNTKFVLNNHYAVIVISCIFIFVLSFGNFY